MRLVRGAPGAGKTALVFREFKEALRQDREAVRLVVPTATLVRHFQHEMARDGEVIPPDSILSLGRFTHSLAPQLNPVPKGLLRIVVRNVLAGTSAAQFDAVSQTNGMAATILEAIELFENAAATPDKLLCVRGLKPDAKAFEKVWREVAAAVRKLGFATRTDVMRAAAEGLGPMRVWMDGFLNFSPPEKEFVKSLAAICDLTVVVTDAPVGDDIRRFALQLGAEERLLHGVTRKPPIVTVSAASMEREADETARRILDLSSKGVAFREMAVAVRDTASYAPLLRETFERFGIPARFYFAAPLRQHSVARFLSGLIECVTGGWEFGMVLETLAAHPNWGSSAAFDRFDFMVRQAMPGRGAEALAALGEKDLVKHVRECLAINAWRDDLLTSEQWQSRFEQMAASLYKPGTLAPARDFEAVESARSHIAAMRAWSEAVECAAAFLKTEERVSLEKFWRAVSEAIEVAVIRIPDDRRDVVHVMSASEARQWDVAALFVLGMTDRNFPRKNTQNLLFPDSEIEALMKAGIPLRRAADLDREEAGLFDSLKTRASRSLVLTWPAHDASGKSAESSRFLSEVNAVTAEPVLCRATPALSAPGAGAAGRIDAPALLQSLAAQHQNIGLTALEDLSQCRFKFFAGRTLGLKGRPERPQERLNPRANGLILHGALEAWLNVRRAGEFRDVFEAAFDRYCQEKRLPPGYRLEAERIALRAVARGVSARERWNVESSEAEVELSLDFPGGVTVNCRVDRIDRIGEGNCVIVDYKSGGTARVRGLVDSVYKLQGPFYALAARERKNLNTVAMMYIAIREDKLFGWGGVPDVDLQLRPIPPRWMEDARDRAIERLGDLLSGAIHPDPADPEQCQWCDYAHACRFGAEAARTERAHGA